jgi:hypothetical protein
VVHCKEHPQKISSEKLGELTDGSNKAILLPSTTASNCLAFHTLPHLLL